MNPLKSRWLSAGLCLAVAGSLATAQKTAQEARRELQAIEKEFQQELKELRKAAKEALDEEAAGALYGDFYSTIVPEFARRCAALAREVRGTEEGLEAWLKVVELASQSQSSALGKEALDALATDHVQSEKLAKLAGSLRYSAQALGEETVTAGLKTIADRTPHRSVRAAALYNLGAVLGDDRPAGDPRLLEARTVLASLAEFTDVQNYDGRSYAEAAKSFLFALDNLVVGKPCPDFAAVDAEGASFKLSDYEGKVVLIDFWGFW